MCHIGKQALIPTMKKLLFRLFPFLFVAVLCGCEEDDSPLLFDTVENTNPQNVKIEYYSPDPSCVPRSYTITTNGLAGELTLRCSNAQIIYFGEIGSNSRAWYGVTDSGEVDMNTLVFDDGNWYVTLVDNNSLRFVFRESAVNPDLDFVLENDYVKVRADSKGKVLETTINVWRNLNLEAPLNTNF